MKIDPKLLNRGTRITIDEKPIYLKIFELMDIIAYMGNLKIVLDNEVVCETEFCYDIYCGTFGERFAEMKLKRVANMYLLGHPLLDVPWIQKTIPCPVPQKGNEQFILEKQLDAVNYVRAEYSYYRF